MASDFSNIHLFADSHAVEVMTFGVILGIPIDHADIRRFENEIQRVKEVYPSITSPETIQLTIGSSGQNLPPPAVPIKELKHYSPDGTPEWAGLYDNDRIQVSCHKYQGWENDWPRAKKRLDLLLGFINPNKPVLSVDYSITNSFMAKKSENVLTPSTLFARPNTFISPQILQLDDPRWNFDQGWFESLNNSPSTLVRISGQGRIEGDRIIATIGSLYARRDSACGDIGKLLKSSAGKSLADTIFEDFHIENKKLLDGLLVSELVDRMGLNAT